MTTTSKVIRVTYILAEEFKIPDWIDLDDKLDVAFWEVKYNTLTITYADGHEDEIEGEGWVEDFQFQHPESVDVISVDENGREIPDKVNEVIK